MVPNQLQRSVLSRPFISSKLHDGISADGEWRTVKRAEEPLEPQATTVEVKTPPPYQLLPHNILEYTPNLKAL